MRKLSRGSVLVYTLLVLMVLLVSGMAFATVVLVQQRGATTTGGSINAFQAANDGFEDLTAKYKSDPDMKLSEIGSSCDNGEVTVDPSENVRGYTATFSQGETKITNCNTFLSEADHVKVVATVGSSTRAIETAFAATEIGRFQTACSSHSDAVNGGNTWACCRTDTVTGKVKCKAFADYSTQGISCGNGNKTCWKEFGVQNYADDEGPWENSSW